MGQAKSFTVGASGFPWPTFGFTTSGKTGPASGFTGTLPAGLRYTSNQNTVRISGTPTTGGTYSITLAASNSQGTAAANQTFTLTVNQPSEIRGLPVRPVPPSRWARVPSRLQPP